MSTLGPCSDQVGRPAASADARLRHFIGSNEGFLRELAKLPVYAACDAGVLILGETGTGKQVCAQGGRGLVPSALGRLQAARAIDLPRERCP